MAVQITVRCTVNASLTSATVPKDTTAKIALTTLTKSAAENAIKILTVGTEIFGTFASSVIKHAKILRKRKSPMQLTRSCADLTL
jgi:hypothetical protein